MRFLLADSTQKIKWRRIHGTLMILFSVSLSSAQLQILLAQLLFLSNIQKPNIHQRVTCGKTLNLVWKMKLELFLKIQESIRILILKRRLRNLHKPVIENQKDELRSVR